VLIAILIHSVVLGDGKTTVCTMSEDNGGISLASDYPYYAMDQSCNAEWDGPVSV